MSHEPCRLISINVGLPREVEWDGKTIRTSIWKSPVAGTIRVRTLNLEGDAQSDLSVHGGPNKAVYAYPSEHYAHWLDEFPDMELVWGAFGENLTIAGLLEAEVQIGDRLHIGTAAFRVTQPRLPCFKLGIRFRRADMVKRFLHSGRTGWYLAVEREGEITAGDAIEITHRAGNGVTVPQMVARLTSKAQRDQQQE